MFANPEDQRKRVARDVALERCFDDWWERDVQCLGRSSWPSDSQQLRKKERKKQTSIIWYNISLSFFVHWKSPRASFHCRYSFFFFMHWSETCFTSFAWTSARLTRSKPISPFRSTSTATSLISCWIPSFSVKTLKNTIEKEHGIAICKQILIISGGELLDDDAVQVCMKTRDTGAGTVGVRWARRSSVTRAASRRRTRFTSWINRTWNEHVPFRFLSRRAVFPPSMIPRSNNG